MKTIKIKQMKLLNFKGIRQLTINFTDTTNIYGANAAGKTTIPDAFGWLFFGKDTAGRSDFNVKTLDANNKEIPEIEHSVEATISIDGQETVITKTMKDNWVKRRGSTEKIFEGNVTEFYVNNVPKKKREFQEFVDELVKEDVLRMLTSPLHFNKMEWKERRDIVLQMVPQPTNEQILAIEPDVEPIIEMLEKKSTDDIKAELAVRKIKLSKDLVDLPGRIDEAKRGMHENPTLDDEMIEVKKAEKLTLEQRLTNSKQILEEVENKQNELHQLAQSEQYRRISFDTKQNELEYAFNTEQDKEPSRLQHQISSINQEIQFKKNSIVDIEQMNRQSENLKAQLDKLLTEYKNETTSKFELNERETVCPTCQRKLDNLQEKITELEEKFKTHQEIIVTDINNQGIAKKTQLDELMNSIREATKNNELTNTEINTLVSEHKKLEEHRSSLLAERKQYVRKEFDVDEVKELRIKQLTTELENVNSWTSAQKTIQTDIDNLNREIDREYMRVENELKQNAQTEERIEELKSSELNKNIEIAKTEQLQDLLTTYIITRVNLIETEVNNKFKLARFKMFEEQINGGIKETCEVTVDGVPYSDLNNAMKINVGLDVINALNSHFNVLAPVFIDNRESVTQIIATQAQIINLVVSKDDKELRIA